MDKLLIPIMNLIPGGWKTATGLLGLLALQVGLTLGYVSQETADSAQNWLLLLFGIGVYQKATKAN